MLSEPIQEFAKKGESFVLPCRAHNWHENAPRGSEYIGFLFVNGFCDARFVANNAIPSPAFIIEKTKFSNAIGHGEKILPDKYDTS
jgi:hypothetical protein